VFDVIVHTKSFSYEDTFTTDLYHLLALFKGTFTKYLQAKLDEKVNINKYIISAYERGETEVILKTFKFINQFVEKQLKVENNEEKTTEEIFKFLVKLSYYEKIKDALDDLNISVKDIEDLVLEDGETLVGSWG
jgi:predicted transcriptional regulator